MKRILVLAVLLSVNILDSDCDKILGIFHFPSKSHNILGSTLLKALAVRGHEVTMMSPFPLETPFKNYEDISLADMLNKEGNMSHILHMQNSSIVEKVAMMAGHVNRINEGVLNHSALKNLIASNRKFDLVIVCWAWNSVFLGLAHQLEASTIAFSTVGANAMINSITANPAPYSYVPNIVATSTDNMSFLQRTVNTVTNIAAEIFEAFVVTPMQEGLRQKYFPQAPPLQELLRNISLVLLNSHHSIESPRPYVPNMIQIGGFHVEQPSELKGELNEFLDSAVEGVIFFSLGSNVKSSDLSSDKLTAIIGTFSKLPLKILWKFEKADLPNLPSNVKIGKWLPQRDILAHRNVKLFVTHGGLLSTTEAVYHGIPMVGIPFFGDQDANVADGVSKGYLIKVELNDLTELTLTNAINEALNNAKYRENIQGRSKVLRDQPLKPLDNAVFWVEYVLRHKGAHHLKTSALKLEWYQYYLLDVIGFLLGVILAIILTTCFVLRKLIKIIKSIFKTNKNTSNVSKGRKKKIA